MNEDKLIAVLFSTILVVFLDPLNNFKEKLREEFPA